MTRTPTILLLLLTSFFMTGCGYIVKYPEIDQALLDCPPLPEIPDSPVTNLQDAIWKNDLMMAHAECKSKLTRVAEIQAQVKKKDLFGNAEQ